MIHRSVLNKMIENFGETEVNLGIKAFMTLHESTPNEFEMIQSERDHNEVLASYFLFAWLNGRKKLVKTITESN